MKIIIIRHCDPDYSRDSLTEKGFQERAALTEYLQKLDIRAFYVSVLGRAKETVLPALKEKGLPLNTYDWLKEFVVEIPKERWNEKTMRGEWHPWYMAWDRLPSDWTAHEELYGKDSWRTVPGFDDPAFLRDYDNVCSNLDLILASHGYVRDGLNYRAEHGNMDTIAFVCHFGAECVLLSHLLNISPELLWQATLARPSSITSLVTEEREKGIACFRMTEFGGTPHLYASGQTPSPSGLFKECFENYWERQ